LLLHFDKHISPECARRQLNVYIAPKSTKLASIEAYLMDLAVRAAVMFPAGPSRVAFYNMELVNAFIRCLPLQSSSIVQMKYNELSARLGRAATAAELSRAVFSASPPYQHIRINKKRDNFIRGTTKYKTAYCQFE
jgi:hypothetical protein